MKELYSLHWWDVEGNQHRELHLKPFDDRFQSTVHWLMDGPLTLGKNRVARVLIMIAEDTVEWDSGWMNVEAMKKAMTPAPGAGLRNMYSAIAGEE